MIPVSQALANRYQPIEAEGLQPVSSITPVDAASAESPLWQRLRPGLQLVATLLQRAPQSGNTAQNGQMAMYQVALSLPDSEQDSAAETSAPLKQLVWMQLPASLPEGQRLQLQVLRGAGPHAQPEVKWAPTTQASSSMAGLDHSPRAALDLPAQATEVRLSSPAKQLQQWMSQSASTPQATILQAREVVSQHPEKALVLAQDLKHALDRSGLFYESHLKEATLGSRPWHQLLQEPQNLENFQAPQTVAQQLQVLEQQRLTWQGEVWPGQHMTWQVGERPNHQADNHAHADSIFSNLTLHLPHLGEVSVRMTMVDGKLTIRLASDASDGQLQLKAGRPQLVERLTAAGVNLTGVQITQGVLQADETD